MPIVGIRELARRTSALFDQVEKTGERILVTRNGRAVGLIVPLDSEEFEDFVLANAPEFVQGKAGASRAPRMGEPGYLPDHTTERRAEYKRTTPGQCVAEAIALSRLQTRIASGGRARRGR